MMNGRANNKEAAVHFHSKKYSWMIVTWVNALFWEAASGIGVGPPVTVAVTGASFDI